MSQTDEMNGLVTHLLAQRNARKDGFATLRKGTAALRTDIRATHSAMTKAQTEKLAANHAAIRAAAAQLAENTAKFRQSIQANYAAMAQTQAETLTAARTQLTNTRHQMSVQIADFRRTVQTANQTNAKTLHEKLTAERTQLLAETTQFIGEIQADLAGAAAAWQSLLQGQAGASAGKQRKPAKGTRSKKSDQPDVM